VLFSFINFLVPLQPTAGGQPSESILLIQTASLAIFAVLGGFLLDFIGRKRIAITGFILLGLAAAARGIDYTGTSSLYFSAIFEGTAWGLLLVLFILTLWGDLSDTLPSHKYYVIGVIPFFVSMFIGFTVGNQIEDNLPATSLFPFAAFFLFIAVLPLFYSPETLPDKIIKGRELKSYLEKAQKFAQKETEKQKRNETKKDQEKDEDETEKECENEEEEQDYVEFEVGQEVVEKAQELAEKYY
jgi:MFS family permease